MGKKKEKLEGVFRANDKGFGFVEFEDDEMEDVFIPPKSVNGALNGDKVRISIYKQKEGSRKAEAKVIKIIKREKETVVGIFQKSKNFGFVVPDDKKFLTDILFLKRNVKKLNKMIKLLLKF